MKCNNCGNEYAFHVRMGSDKDENGKRVTWERCDKCSDIRVDAMPDVSDVHEPYFDEHLADLKDPQGQMVYSRKDKSEKLKALGLREKRESKIKYYSDPKQRQTYFIDNFGR